MTPPVQLLASEYLRLAGYPCRLVSDAAEGRGGLSCSLAQQDPQRMGVLVADFSCDGFQRQFGSAEQVGCPLDPQVLHEADGRGSEASLDRALQRPLANADRPGRSGDTDGLG